jgi:lipopolysaccharide biosynthesis regulator YciM
MSKRATRRGRSIRMRRVRRHRSHRHRSHSVTRRRKHHVTRRRSMKGGTRNNELTIQQKADAAIQRAELIKIETRLKADDLLKKVQDEKANEVDMVDLGYMYKAGEGVKRDYGMAAELFKSAMYKNPFYSPAVFALAMMLYQGKGVDKNYEAAARLFHIGAEQNNAAAMYRLSLMYENGEGVDKDVEKASEFLNKAADMKYGLAVEHLNKHKSEQGGGKSSRRRRRRNITRSRNRY